MSIARSGPWAGNSVGAKRHESALLASSVGKPKLCHGENGAPICRGAKVASRVDHLVTRAVTCERLFPATLHQLGAKLSLDREVPVRLPPSSCTFGALVCSTASVLLAPLPAQWVTFQNQTSTRLVAVASLGSADIQEKDYAWGDFDQDGDIDLVVVRKQPFTSPGAFPNVLFMNENGVLTDRTATLASASSVVGSQGFLDATNDRDVVAVDVNGDGWLDLVTATTLT
ncbi:MAG TPA: VCBS repeat-containing protein, partial [Planctomycetota bacterium]|nr:VCBS repeat-containing protein [Planctomycetota bacterium]